MIGYHFSFFSASPQELTLKRGQSMEIKVNILTTNVFSLPPPLGLTVASGMFTLTDDLSNSTAFSSEDRSHSLESIHRKKFRSS
jgi:hypothetical protein